MNTYQDQRLWVQAYEWIREGIHNGYLKTDEPLSENRLSQEISVSRTPIREALRVLAQDGYVKILPTKGAFVTNISSEDIREIYDIRKLLEPFTAISATLRVPNEEIAASESEWLRIKEQVDRGNRIPWSQVAAADKNFHSTVIRYSTNKKIKQILFSYLSQIERFQCMTAESFSNVENTVLQHMDLIASLKERDAGVLSKKLYEHILRGEKRILKDFS